ncbi:MAG TPA: 1-deoxy-D-xylulose-5-phosphate synthase, partial [Cryomorphaceae bacterium]|nr:1-deoxy-D-xylulose-5-phosphate synthase [Cryomorphaceae bacterium]
MITDLRALELQELPAFTKGLVDQVVARVRDKITHLESSVAVAELTVALHYVLNTPEDVLIWDVGHQGY